MASRKRNLPNDSDVSPLYKEWDESSCPICMDHPHNAVLLICTSHGKGCRSYICDTSYRHSNCLDRFKQLKEENPETQYDSANTSALVSVPGGSGEIGTHHTNPDNSNVKKLEQGLNLRCPLCRGSVLGWKVLDEARKYLNSKSRSCSHESCPFVGSYRELRQHARRIHPTVRPADVDLSRQTAWRRLEDQREYNDIVSAIRSAMPGAILLGDYAIDNENRVSIERGERGGGESSRMLSTFFLFHMFGSMDQGGGELRGGSRSRLLPPRRRRNLPRQRYLWGDNLLGLQGNNDDDDDDEEEEEEELSIQSDIGDDVSQNPRRRRRMTRSQSDEDQA